MSENILQTGLEQEKKEQESIETRTMNRDDFSDLLYKDGSTEIADSRFKQGGSFKYFEPKDLVDIANRESYFSTVSVGNKIVGICKLQKIPDGERSYWVSFVSVDSDYRNKGFSKRLLEEVLRFSKNNNLNLVASSYSEEGYAYVKENLAKLARNIGVNFEDTDKSI